MDAKKFTPDEMSPIIKLLQGLGLKLSVETDSDQEPIAYHEAGHATVGHLTGGKVISISIEDELRAADIEHPDPAEKGITANERLERIENKAMTRLAGPISERRKSGKCQGWGDDIPQLVSLLLEYGSSDQNGAIWLTDLVERTERLVHKHWDEVQKIANVLLQRKVLDEAEIGVIRKQPMRRSRFSK